MKDRPRASAALFVWLGVVITGLPGCAAVTAVGLAGGAAYAGHTYYSTNIAEKVFAVDLEPVYQASLQAAREVNLFISNKKVGEKEALIVAYAGNIRVSIKIGLMTAGVTRVTVDAARPSLLRERALAVEVLERITKRLKPAGSTDIRPAASTPVAP